MKFSWNIKASVSLGMIILGLLWLKVANQITSAGIGDSSIWGTGATVPKFLLTAWIILCVTTLITDVMEAGKAEAVKTGNEEAHKKGILFTIVLIALLFVYFFIIDYIGYIISTIALLIISMFLFGERRKLLLVAVPVIFTLLMYVVFTYALKIQLPAFGG